MSKVSLLKCDEYSNEILKQKITESLLNIGFDIKKFNNARVALKPNLLLPSQTKKAIITHPEFFRAVAQIVKENNGSPVIIESPAFHALEYAIRKTGYSEVIKDEGIEVADPKKIKTLHYEGSKSFKSIEISDAFFDVDMIINLPKFKTHGLTYFTGAVKNLFGVIPGLRKSKTHIKIPAKEDFAEFLLDLNGALKCGFDKPVTLLHIMDAIVAQEGEGPGHAGSPKRMNAVIVGEDAVAVDFVATSVSGLEISKALTITRGFERDLFIQSPDEIEVVGDKIEDLKINDFKPSRDTVMSNMLIWPVTSKRFKNLFVDRPVPDKEKCTLCYHCKTICPAGAIEKAVGDDNTPQYDYKKCIRCYCCMEICPDAAINKKRGRLQWMIRV